MAEPKSFGKILPPYGGVSRCASASCQDPVLSEETGGAYLFTDLESSKLCVFCGDCTAYVELNRPDRFKLIML